MNFWPFKRKQSTGLGPIETALIQSRAFAAAEISSHLAPWTFDGGFSNGELAASLATVRSRARDMAKNSEYFARWLQLFVANVAGPTGFRFKSQAEKADGDVTADSDAAYFVECAWEKWASNPAFVDASGCMDLAAVLRLVVETWARDGEAFVLVNRSAQNPFGVSLRVVRPDCIDETLNARLSDTVAIRLGVEINLVTGRKVAYYFDADRTDPTGYTVGSRRRVRIPAEDVLHLYVPKDADQVRGFPLAHPFIKKLKMLDEFDQAELVAARDEVNTLGIFKAPAGREGEIKALAKDDAVRSRLEAPSTPGQKIVLTQGWDYEAKHPNHPNAGLPAFKTAMLRDIASGAGVEYANFANDWSGVSYSSVRAGTLAERDQWLIHQAAVIQRVLDPLFRIWLASFLTLRASGSYMISDLERLTPHQFIGRRWTWVDPMKDIQATVLAIKNGLVTHSKAAAEYGTDTDDNLEENARVDKAFKDAGLPSPFATTTTRAEIDASATTKKESKDGSED